ncbi:Protein MGA2 [Pelomyxa schiedti]|nr:Protein MGA2 [Pelomyxa schiedti]
MEYLSEHSTPTPPAATPPPTPPPPSFSAGRVNTSVSSSHSTIESRTTQPAFRQQSNNPMELRLLGVPQKSRVETQIRLCVQLVASSGQIGGGLRWKYLYLPPDMCNNDLRSVNTHSSSSSSLKGHDLSTTLNVQTKVLCASDNREVLMCMGCVQRERRSLERKKHNITPSPSQPSSRPSTPSLNSAGVSGAWPEMIDQEQRKIVQFHSSPLIDFTSGEAIISLRITCYCRHHNEKVGFRIHLSLVDPITGELVASSVSSPVLITDDHKTSVKRTAKRPRIDPDYEDKHTTPVIQKVIPNIGPIAGGIEVTLLGTGFSSSNLVHFGPYIALSLNCWNATTIVCTLPPSGKAGTVHVTINGNESSANEPALFTYRDDSDQRLLEIALQLIGLKFSGRVESPKSVAMQILSIGQTSTSTTTSTIQENINQVSALPPQGLEKVVLNAMRLIDNMEGNAIDVSLEDNFHRNILHYASIKGFADLLGWCLQKAPALSVVNSKDSMGNSPLHYSCFYAHPQTTKLLLSHQADMSSCNLSGCTPCDMAQHATSSSTLIAPSLPQLRHHIPSATRRTSQTLPYPPQRLPPILSAAPTSTANLPPFANSPFQHHLSSQPAIKAERKSITKVGEYIISVESAANHTKPPFTETLAETRADIALNLHILETIEDDPERPLNTEIAIETTNKTTRYLADQNIDPVLEPSGKKGSYSLLELQPLERTTLHFTKPSFSRAGHPQYSSSKSNLKVTTSNKRTSCPRTRKLNGSKNPYAAVCTSPTTADTRQKKLSKLEQIRKTLDKPSSYLELSTTCETKQPCNETELSTAYLSVSFEDPVTSQFSLNNDAEIPQTEYGTTKGRKFKTFFRGEWWQRQAPKALLVAGLGIVGICAVVGLLMGPVGFSWNGTDHLVHSSESVDPGHSNKVALYYSLLCAVCISAVATLVIAYRWVGQESKPGRGRLILGSLLISCAAFDVLLLSGFFVALFTGK